MTNKQPSEPDYAYKPGFKTVVGFTFVRDVISASNWDFAGAIMKLCTVMLVLGLGLGLDSVDRGRDAIMLYTCVHYVQYVHYKYYDCDGMEFVPLGY